ncbi:MAG: radical SAM protein [Candidatus Omnitrophota bacterium]
MNLRDNYYKFKRHLESKGGFYALCRGLKYILYLFRHSGALFRSRNIIEKGKLKLVFNGHGISIFWDNIEITKNAGLNCGIKISEAWTDSTKAKWKVLESGPDLLKFSVCFKKLPLRQIWTLGVDSQEIFLWHIDLEVKSSILIDELRFINQVRPVYKAWLSDYLQNYFPRLDNCWHDLNGNEDGSVCLVGLRHPRQADIPRCLVLETQDGVLPALIQNTPKQHGTNLIGFKLIRKGVERNYYPGMHSIFSCRINIFIEDEPLDIKIEHLRRSIFDKSLAAKAVEDKTRKKPSVSLVNLPWKRGGKWGVRAGSRWPHILDDSETNYLPFPFFLAYAAALLQKNYFSVSLIDAIAEQLDEEVFLKKITGLNIDFLVAETSTPSFYNDLAILKKIHSSLGIPIILCGPHFEIYQTQILKDNDFIAYTLFGEYEFTLLELLVSLAEKKDLSGVKGLIWRAGSDVIKNPAREACDINLLPWPLRDALPMGKYMDLPGGLPIPSVQMLSSRGCPFRCTFCLWPQVFYSGRDYRPRDVGDVVNEMEYLVKVKGFKSIYFDDDTFNIGKERILEFCKQVRGKGLQNIPWAVMARADLMDKGILSEMKSAGLWAVKYGVESENQLSVDDCEKRLDLRKVTEIVGITKSLGIKTHLTFCFGFPGETDKSIRKTIDYSLKLDSDSAQFSILTPFPGTELFERLDNENRILTKDWSKYDGHHSCVFQPDILTVDDLEKAKEKACVIWAQSKLGKRHLGYDFGLLLQYQRIGGLAYALKRAFHYCSGRVTGAMRNSYERMFGFAKGAGFLTAKFLKYIIDGDARRHYLQLQGVHSGEYAFVGPNHVQVDLTNNCNNNCLACWCNSPLLEEKALGLEAKEQELPLNLVKRLLDELASMRTKEIYFSGGGEPFVHPDIMEILEYAKHKKFICYVNTNFTLFDRNKIDSLVRMRMDHLTVSTWAATPNTYSITHPNKDKSVFCDIIDNLKYLNSIKRGKPGVKLYNVIFNKNFFELEDMIEIASRTGSEFVEFTLIDTIPGKTEELLLDSRQIAELRNLAEKISCKLDNAGCYKGVKVLNFKSFLRRIASDSDLKKATYDRNIIDKIPCYAGWIFSRIMPNGDVNACLKAHRIPMGNLYKASFREIWNGDKQRYFRKKTLVYEKNDCFFKSIGNDPEVQEAGCYKSCDDIERNTSFHRKVSSLNLFEKNFVGIFSKLKRVKIRNGKKI